MRREIDQMREKWSGRRPGYLDSAFQKRAAVLLPLLEREDGLHLLFEVRSDSLRNQPGEICFPGGAMDPGEPAMEAAIRETMEELLIAEDQIEVLAPLDRLAALGNLTVYPFLGSLKKYEGTFSRDEVAGIFTVPVEWFLAHEPELYHARLMTVPEEDFPFDSVPEGADYKWRQGRHDVLFYRYENYIIWGMTAKFTHSFIEMYRSDLGE